MDPDRFFDYQVICGFSSREDGSLSKARGEEQEVIENRRRFLGNYGVELNEVVFTRLVHGIEVAAIKNKELGESHIDEYDGMITRLKNVFLFCTAADCVPLMFFDPIQGVVGLGHAGWRGALAGLPRAVISRMQEEFNCNPADIRAWIGPSAGKCCYDRMDLRGACVAQLEEVGIVDIGIDNSCTICDSRYFSHRGNKFGGMGVFIGMRE